ncbi:MAG: PhnE/PtxC family ABC transporter permease [Planctomycetota bacterium]
MPPDEHLDGPPQAGDRRASRWVFAALALAVVIGSGIGSEFRPDLLFSERALTNAGNFLRECWPPRTDGEFVRRLLGAALDTVALAVLGTALAVLVGLPLGILGSRVVTGGALFASGEARQSLFGRVVYLAARGIGIFLRSIPELIWALVFVRMFELGPTPAVLALGLAYGGMLGKVYSEQLEAIDPEPVAALEASGAGRVATLGWGVLPQALGPMVAYTGYRFECAVRASALMGFVGAGGIGFELEVSMKYDYYREVITEVVILVAVVGVLEWVADSIRRRVA